MSAGKMSAGKKEQGVRAVNQDFVRYDQVDKPHRYHLAEGDHGDASDEQFDEQFVIKTCDIGAYLHGNAEQRACFVQEFGSALEEIGFAILVGHGVDPKGYDQASEKVIELFTGLSLEEKIRYRAQRYGSVNQGYFPIKETSDIHPDLVEGWVFCRRAFDLEGSRPTPYRVGDFWPLPAQEPFFRGLCQEHEKLILPIMQSILQYIRCDPHLYDEKLTGTNFGLRLNYYPPVAQQDAHSGAGRLLGHEDVDLFTILPAPRVEGLQVLNRKNMKWVRLLAPPGSIIINTGDYMQRITNDILPSTTHRVSKPRNPELLGESRVSFPMAVYVWEDELLEVLPGLPNPKYSPIKAITFHTRTTSKFYGDDYAVEK
ncbi:MAG: 2OG-Fe(II) oxygenase family protein [Planctomycetota bacterium]